MPHPVVIYSQHAADRMRTRAITEQQVADALASPDRIYLEAKGNPVAEKEFGPDATVRVVFVDRIGQQGPFTHIITVMWK